MLFDSTSHPMLVTGIHLAKVHLDLEQDMGIGGEEQRWWAASWRLMALIQVGLRDGRRRQKLSWVSLSHVEGMEDASQLSKEYFKTFMPGQSLLLTHTSWCNCPGNFVLLSTLHWEALAWKFISISGSIYGEHHTYWLKCI